MLNIVKLVEIVCIEFETLKRRNEIIIRNNNSKIVSKVISLWNNQPALNRI